MRYKVLLALVISFAFQPVFANSGNELPLYCYAKGYNFSGENAVLGKNNKAAEQQLFLLKNLAATKVWINHETEHTSASAGWAIELEPGKWTALMLDQQPFELKCAEVKPGSEQLISCQLVLQICQMQHVEYGVNTKGSYWAAENLSIEALWDALERRGITQKTKRV